MGVESDEENCTMAQSIYANHYDKLNDTMQDVLSRIGKVRRSLLDEFGMDPIEHCLARIKSEESMREKCRHLGLPESQDSALRVIHDAIGIRIVCAFLDDVYRVAAYLKSFDDLEVYEEKDYIRNVKPNGYRSYHLILRVPAGYFVEIQLRTISMDTWAALEHHMKYKKKLTTNLDLIGNELKRCADELASTDVSMQEIRNLIFNSN